MSATKVKWPRAVALDVAREILGWIKPLCVRVIVAGSLRRKKAEVGDVEILYIARFLDWPDPLDLLRQPVPTNVTDHALGKLRDSGLLLRRLKEAGMPIGWGDDNKYAIHAGSGVPVDFFRATGATWWNNLVCRTGGAQSNTALCLAAQERGWKWNPTSEGFTRVSGTDRGRVHVVKSEREVFEFAGLEYLPPEERA